MTPFRFGVNTWTASSSRDWAAKARRVEALGYSTLFMADHLADTFAPFTALALAAAAERENVETRPPGVEVALHPASR